MKKQKSKSIEGIVLKRKVIPVGKKRIIIAKNVISKEERKKLLMFVDSNGNLSAVAIKKKSKK